MSQTLNLKVLDVTGQLEKHASVPPEASVAELVEQLVDKLALPKNDLEGRRIVYHLRSEKSGMALGGSEPVGEILEQVATVRLMPEIVPGGHNCSRGQ